MAGLYRQRPCLWGDFGRVVECTQLLATETWPYRRLCGKLSDLGRSLETHFSSSAAVTVTATGGGGGGGGGGDWRRKEDVAEFAAVTGLAEQGAAFLDRVMRRSIDRSINQ